MHVPALSAWGWGCECEGGVHVPALPACGWGCECEGGVHVRLCVQVDKGEEAPAFLCP